MASDTMLEKHTAEEGRLAERTRGGQVYRPDVDILEDAEGLTILADMPGVAAADIDVKFENGELTILAPVQPRRGDARMIWREYGVGDYVRTFRVSEIIDAERISAEYRNGVLTLRLPKVEAARPRRIAVSG